MESYQTEEQQVEALKTWWKENGRSVIAGVVIGVSAIFGWKAWQGQQQREAEQSSALYQQLLQADESGQSDSVIKLAEQLEKQHAGSAYAEYSTLFKAKRLVLADDLVGAESLLRTLMEKTKKTDIAHIARIRLAELLIANSEPQKAFDLLESAEAGTFLSQYEGLKGDALVMLGEKGKAREAYQKALAGSDRFDGMLQMKLDNLGSGSVTQ